MRNSESAIPQAESIQNALLKAVIYAIDTNYMIASFVDKLEMCERGLRLKEAGVHEDFYMSDVRHFLPVDEWSDDAVKTFRKFKACFEKKLHLSEYKGDIRSAIEQLTIEFVDMVVSDAGFTEKIAELIETKYRPKSEGEYNRLVEMQTEQLIESFRERNLLEDEMVEELDFRINYHQLAIRELEGEKRDVLGVKSYKVVGAKRRGVNIVDKAEPRKYYPVDDITPEQVAGMLACIPYEELTITQARRIVDALCIFDTDTAEKLLVGWIGPEESDKYSGWPGMRKEYAYATLGVIVTAAVQYGFDASTLYKPKK